jgi:hypothetical protein
VIGRAHVGARALAWLGVLALSIAWARPASAEDDEARRRYKLLRDDERWAWLRHRKSTDVWDPLKYVRLAKDRDDVYLTFGGEIRQWVEGYGNERWGQTGVATNVYWLQRYMVHVDAQMTRYLRVFAQMKSGIEAFRQGGPRSPDKDLLDVNQLYIDAVGLPGATIDDDPRLVLRVGRQEMSYGSGRLIDVREGPNVRFGYDGIRLIARPGPLRMDVFAVRPVKTNPGVFDDGWDTSQAFWGAWMTLNVPWLTADAYLLGLWRDHFKYQKAAGEERRRTLGARVRGKSKSFEVELEGAYQFGSLGKLPIRAWTLAGEAVARGTSLPLRPQATVGFGMTSGDGGSASPWLGTFNAPFPRGAYFGLVSANGPSNDVGPHAALALSLPASITLTGEVWAFWRQSVHDGVYAVPGVLLRPGNADQARYLGTQFEVFAAWQVDRHLSLNATFARFWAGDFFRTSAPGHDITYAAGWATYKL